MVVLCNNPKVNAPEELRQLLRMRWCPPNGLNFEVIGGQFKLFGCGEPVVYRIPMGMSPDTAYPGRQGTVSCPLDYLLADVAPYLQEPLLIELRDKDTADIRWQVLPGTAGIRKVVNAAKRKRTVFWAPQHPITIHQTGRRDNHIGGFLVHAQKFGAVMLRMDTIHPRGYANVRMSREEALKLGLALVQASSGTVDPDVLRVALEEHKFFLGKELNDGENQSCVSGDGEDQRTGSADLRRNDASPCEQSVVQPGRETLEQAQ